MRFFPAEPDIATVFNRIVGDDIDLQPDFQRGEVWSSSKQQRLIDSILRGWIVPPILLMASRDGKPQQVLDGQQRLASIRDFKLNKFSVDGRIEPYDTFISSLHGKRYADLPTEVAKAFDKTTLRLYEIDNYRPEEPAEIFFRLNQPTVLTSAEKRNAFFGPVRDVIRGLVDELKETAGIQEVLGFSNSRMAYDDVLARFACALEFGTLRKKVTAGAVNEMYRRSIPLDHETAERLDRTVRLAIQIVGSSAGFENAALRPRLNKATFFSWLLFVSRLNATGDVERVTAFFYHFESVRAGLSSGQEREPPNQFFLKYGMIPSLLPLLYVYIDRATSRVADISSVLIRDFAIWLSWYEFSRGASAGCFDPAYARLPEFLSRAEYANSPVGQFDAKVLGFIDEIKWGEVI